MAIEEKRSGGSLMLGMGVGLTLFLVLALVAIMAWMYVDFGNKIEEVGAHVREIDDKVDTVVTGIESLGDSMDDIEADQVISNSSVGDLLDDEPSSVTSFANGVFESDDFPFMFTFDEDYELAVDGVPVELLVDELSVDGPNQIGLINSARVDELNAEGGELDGPYFFDIVINYYEDSSFEEVKEEFAIDDEALVEEDIVGTRDIQRFTLEDIPQENVVLVLIEGDILEFRYDEALGPFGSEIDQIIESLEVL